MRRSLAVVSAFLFSLPVFAQQAAPTSQATPQRDPQAIAVLRNALATMGGGHLAQIQDTVVQATLTPAPGDASAGGTVTITTKGPDKLRFDGNGAGKASTVLFSKGRELRSSGNSWREAPSANADHKRIEHLPALLLAYELARGDFSAAYVAEESLAGRSVHHIRLTRISNLGNGVDETLIRNSQLDIWLDAQTSLISKISYLYLSENDWRIGVPVEIYYYDYRSISGILVPFHQKCVFDGLPVDEMQITSFDINKSPVDSKFEGR